MQSLTNKNELVGNDDSDEKNLLPNTQNGLNDLADVLSENNYDNEISRLENDLSQLDTIYGKLSKHTIKLIDNLDEDPDANTGGRPKRMGTADTKPKRGPSPTYIASQFANMISFKTLTLSYLKQLKDLKDSRLDRAAKIIAQIKKADGDTEGFSEAEIFRYLMSLSSQNQTKTVSQSEGTVIDADADIDFDSIVEQRLEGVSEIPVYKGESETSAEHMKNEENVEDVIIEQDIATSEDSLEDTPLDKIKFKPNQKFYIEVNDDEEVTAAYIIDEEYNILKTLDIDDIDFSYDEENDSIYAEGYEGIYVEVAEDE